MSVGLDTTTGAVLAAFDDHLRRVRGVCAGTRVNYTRFVRSCLEQRFPGGTVEVGELDAHDVVEFVTAATRRYQPRTVELVATSLRSFFRFLRGEGLGRERGWKMRCPWCRTVAADLSGTWTRHRSSS